MPKNGGGKQKKKNKHHTQNTRALVLAEDGQYYALVNKLLGNGRVMVSYIDPKDGLKEVLANIRGTLRRKKQWVNVNNYILIALRDFEDKSDVIHVYNDSEMNILKRKGHIPDGLKGKESNFQNDDLEFTDFTGEEEPEEKPEKVRGLGRNNVVKLDYGIISSDEDEEEEDNEE